MRHAAALLWILAAFSAPVQALELNQANEAELDSLRGMGPALTAQVLRVRAEGLFTDWRDFQTRVPGIGAAKARTFAKQGLTVNGQPLPASMQKP